MRELAPLVILDGDRVLLERRPDKGIWGGLWSLPECPVAPARAADVLAHARAVLGEFAATLDPLAPVALPEFAHLLTHFRLKISPWLISGSASRISEPVSGLPPDGEQRVIASVCDAAPHRWLSLASCGSAALPQPIKRLLLELTGAARTPDTRRASGPDDLPLFQELTDQ